MLQIVKFGPRHRPYPGTVITLDPMWQASGQPASLLKQ